MFHVDYTMKIEYQIPNSIVHSYLFHVNLVNIICLDVFLSSNIFISYVHNKLIIWCYTSKYISME
jgi:hypothetical protein